MTKQSFSYGATDAFSYDTEDLLLTMNGVRRFEGLAASAKVNQTR